MAPFSEIALGVGISVRCVFHNVNLLPFKLFYVCNND